MSNHLNMTFRNRFLGTTTMITAVLLVLMMVLPQVVLAQGGGSALDFDGNNDDVQFSSSYSLTSESEATYSFWIRPDAGSSVWRGILVQNNNVGIWLDLSNKVQSYPNLIETSTTLTLGNWYHVAFTWDGTTARVYLNGTEDGTSTYNFLFNVNYIGSGVGREYFDGHIDEVRIWNVARTQAEIRDNMCKKLTGSESGLVGYWRMDGTSGTTVTDATSNGNDGTMTNMVPASDRVTSGAAIGDASANDYAGTNPIDFSANIAHTDGDDITATGDGGTVTGIQVYRVDEAPNVTTPPGTYDKIDPLRYWGVFIVGSSPTYTVTYDYGGHPGIQTEANLRLAKRDNGADGTWEDTDVTPSGGKLTKTGESGTEYILGSITADNSLPVELTSFTAKQERGSVVLNWVTESEIENLGFILERRSGSSDWKEIASYLSHKELQGQGSVTYRTKYKFFDNTVQSGVNYKYRLGDVSYDGIVEYHGTVEIAVKSYEEFILPEEFVIRSVYPNPFNPVTTIEYVLGDEMEVSLIVVDLMGRTVRRLVEKQILTEGEYSVKWNGEDDYGIYLPSGVYFSVLEARGMMKSQKIVLLR